MPYKISPKGLNYPDREQATLTDLQRQVLEYLLYRSNEGYSDYLTSSEIGYDLKMHPRAISGIAYSLHKKGLVDKKD